MFSRSAALYDAIYGFKDYAAEAERVHEIVQARCEGAKTLLDVACGTGLHLAELRRWYEVEGLDVEAALLEIARGRLADVPLHEADMTSFDLGREFDAVVCLFSSIGYTRTDEGLRDALSAMARHLRAGGVLLVEPWVLPENWDESHVGAVFVDEPELKIARINTAPPLADTVVLEMHHLVGTLEGVEHFVEHHELGMFAHEQYLEAFGSAGLAVEHDPEGLFGRGLYVGVRGA